MEQKTIIPFNIPYLSGREEKYVQESIQGRNISGDGTFTKKCQFLLEKLTLAPKVLLTSSCTHALELAALLFDVKPGDEIIMPSFTFVSSATAFVLRGAKIVYVDIHPDTMNIDETKIEGAITRKTKAILIMHYAGVACEMDVIMEIARKFNLFVVEDAAQCIGAYYKGRHLGTIGHLGTISFHSTKNIHCGEGGALLINDKRFALRAEIIREKGTNRIAFLRGEVDKYSWVDIGSSYLMSELNAAFLYAQLQDFEIIRNKRVTLLQLYFELLNDKSENLKSSANSLSNGHIYFTKCKSKIQRNDLIQFLKLKGIQTAFHYIPLHSSAYGKKNGHFSGKDQYTTQESNRLLRLPLYFDLSQEDIIMICDQIDTFLKRYLSESIKSF